MRIQANSFQQERENWLRTQKDLLDRAMSKDLATYLQLANQNSPWEVTNESDLRQDDLSELAKMGINPEGYGEILVEMEGINDDIRELGFEPIKPD